METLTLVLLIMAIIIAIFALGGGGFFLGIYANKKPIMTFGVVDYSELKTTGKVYVRHLKYHPTSGSYANPLADMPEQHGLVTLTECIGWYGWIRHSLLWEVNSIVPPKDLKHGYGTYKAELLNGRLKEQLDHLKEENGRLQLLNHELHEQVLVSSRNIEEQSDMKTEKRMKDLQKIIPPMANARSQRSGAPR